MTVIFILSASGSVMPEGQVEMEHISCWLFQHPRARETGPCIVSTSASELATTGWRGKLVSVYSNRKVVSMNRDRKELKMAGR
jgi:hypothetical protein